MSADKSPLLIELEALHRQAGAAMGHLCIAIEMRKINRAVLVDVVTALKAVVERLERL